MNYKWYTKKWVGILLQVTFWLIFFFLPYLLRPDYSGPLPQDKPPVNFFYVRAIDNITWVMLFYLNIFYLIPQLFYKGKYPQYIGSLVLAFLGIFIINRLTFSLLVPDNPYRFFGFILFSIIPCGFIIAVSMAYKMLRDKIKNDLKIKEKETENLKTELSFLRSQISPHFMFNVLNNIVALARKRSDEVETSLIKLSSLLRYMLYETNEEHVALEKEAEYLQSYIELQQQRFGKNLRVNFSFNDIDDNYFIEPMLLVPFVENAFKHGTGMVENAQIDIALKVKKGLLQFDVRNKYNEQNQVKDHTSGIGFPNVQRRLNLLYRNCHNLMIAKEDNLFTVSLQINLH